MAKKIRMKVTVKNKSVLNSTLESNSDSKLDAGSRLQAVLSQDRESDSTKNPNESRDLDPGLLKPLKSLKGDATTTGVSVVNKSPQSSPSSLPTDPPPVDAFHIRLCAAFLSATKAPPTLKQSAEAYKTLQDDSAAFLRWLPTAAPFRATRHAGGLRSLVDFFQADLLTTKETNIEQDFPGTLFDGRIHPSTWAQMSAEEQSQWEKYRPHVPGPWRIPDEPVATPTDFEHVTLKRLL